MESGLEFERGLVRKKLTEWHEPGSIKDIRIETVEDKFDIGNVYYAEFMTWAEDEEDDESDAEESSRKRKQVQHGAEMREPEVTWEEDFFYVLVDEKSEVHLYDDGIEVIRALNTILQRKKTFLQRLAEFSLVDVVGAIIAIFITSTFVVRYAFQYTSGHISVEPNASIDKDLVSIFTVVVGYYFGRVSSSHSRNATQ
jgi:hypothetical protein